jgi:hypothetical protein
MQPLKGPENKPKPIHPAPFRRGGFYLFQVVQGLALEIERLGDDAQTDNLLLIYLKLVFETVQR